MVFKSMMFLHSNIPKYTWTSPDGKTHNHTDHILINRRWHLSILNVQSFSGADCDTDNYLVVTKAGEKLEVSKQAAQKLDVKRFNLRKLNELEVRVQYQITMSNRFAALENLNDSKDIKRALENIKQNVKPSAKGSLSQNVLKQHKPWFDDECYIF